MTTKATEKDKQKVNNYEQEKQKKNTWLWEHGMCEEPVMKEG